MSMKRGYKGHDPPHVEIPWTGLQDEEEEVQQNTVNCAEAWCQLGRGQTPLSSQRNVDNCGTKASAKLVPLIKAF